MWTRPWILRRFDFGATNTVLNELKVDPAEFRMLLRIDVQHFDT